jgi:hypothetical protein
MTVKQITDARKKFVIDYCKAKGWPIRNDPDMDFMEMVQDLTWDRVREIRRQEGWINPKIEI